MHLDTRLYSTLARYCRSVNSSVSGCVPGPMSVCLSRAQLVKCDWILASIFPAYRRLSAWLAGRSPLQRPSVRSSSRRSACQTNVNPLKNSRWHFSCQQVADGCKQGALCYKMAWSSLVGVEQTFGGSTR